MTAKFKSSDCILITGMSGVGKTAVIEELRSRGHTCIDMDEPGWSYMDCDGHQHWEVQRLAKALSDESESTVFVSGCAEEQAVMYGRFRVIILLSAPKEIMMSRIQSRTGNASGQSPEEMAKIMSNLESVEPLLRARCTHEIQTTMPVSEVADRIIEYTCPTKR